jgi:integrase/recombinase XerC
MSMFSDYKAHLQNEDLADLTIKVYMDDAETFASWFEKQNQEVLEPARVTPSDLRSYRQYLQETLRQKASTVNRKLASLASWLRWAMETEQITSNPMDKIKYVQRVRQVPKWLDKHQQYALHRAMEKDIQLSLLRYPKRWVTRRRDVSLVIFMLQTGLRLSETAALTLEDVKVSERSGEVLVRHGKGNKERIVPLKAEAREALREWLKVRPQSAGNHLWITTEVDENDMLTPRAFQRILKRYGQDAGIPNLTPHVLRHTFAKNLADKKVGVEIIARLLGHSNLNTTQIYIQPGQSDLQKAMEE